MFNLIKGLLSLMLRFIKNSIHGLIGPCHILKIILIHDYLIRDRVLCIRNVTIEKEVLHFYTGENFCGLLK